MSELSHPQHFVSSATIIGTNLYDSSARKLGSIKELFIEPASGRIAYVIGATGGFLGVGGKFHPLPWSRLSLRPGLDGYRASFSKAELEAAPAYDMEQLASAQYAWGEQVDTYFGGLTPA